MFRESHGFISVPVTSSKQFRLLHYLDRDQLEKNLCIVSTIRFLLGNLIYEQEIKFRDLLRNNNKLIIIIIIKKIGNARPGEGD